MAALATAIVLFLVFGHYTRREAVSGQLQPSAGVLTLAAQTTGTVTRDLVREGEPVKAGQPLLEISANLVSASMGDTHAVVTAQLHAQEAQARATLANLQPQADAQAKDFTCLSIIILWMRRRGERVISSISLRAKLWMWLQVGCCSLRNPRCVFSDVGVSTGKCMGVCAARAWSRKRMGSV